jgi:hypothetical protein
MIEPLSHSELLNGRAWVRVPYGNGASPGLPQPVCLAGCC